MPAPPTPNPRRTRRRLWLILLSIPATLTALLWIASHAWFIWYCSLPPGTLVTPGTPFPPSVKVRILAGAIHYTDDAEYRKHIFTRPEAPGSMSLGTMYSSNDGAAFSGLSIKWSPYGFSATRWKPQLYPGNWGFPLYIPFTIFLLPPITFWLVTRARIPGHCPKCNYNRTGLAPNAMCPECGTPLPPIQPNPPTQ